MSMDEAVEDMNPSSPAVWDCHVHCYPDSVISNPKAFAKANSESHWLDLVSNGPQGWANPENLVRAMDKEGIEKVVLLGWYWENPQTCRLQNEWYAQSVKPFPDRFMAFAAVHPEDNDPIAELERAHDWGAIGLGECLPSVQVSEGWQHPGWERIISWTTDHKWPINVHVTEAVGHKYPGRVDTPLMDMVELFEKYPDQKWICAHWGGGLPFFSLNRRVKSALRNVWFDTAASPLLYAPEIWKIVTQLVGYEKILFGSDFPLILDPRNHKKPNWSRILSEIGNSGLSDKALKAILNGNLNHLASLRA
jgi:predicted TIM-barrel fold metal-dependent hydrolase